MAELQREKTVAKEMGGRLRQLREDRRLTQKEMGKVLGVTNTAYSNRESGDTGLTPHDIQVLSRFFGVSCAYFFGENNQIAGNLNQQESGLVQSFRECSDAKKLDVYDFAVRSARASKK